jgi:ATP-binding cassette subfamily C protein
MHPFAMRLLVGLIKNYPWRTAIALVAILLAGIADGLSISALLPLLNIATIGTTTGAKIALDSTDVGGQLEQFIVNGLTSVGLEATLGVLLSVIVVGVIIKSLLLLAAETHVGFSAAQITTDLRLELLRSILATRWDYFLHQPIGSLANSIALEAKRSSQSYVFGITMMIFVLQAIIYAGIAVAISWKATLVVLFVGLFILSISHNLVRMTKRAGKKQTLLSKSLLSHLTDMLQSVKPLKAMAREKLAGAILRTETSKLNKALRRQVVSQEALDAIQTPLIAIVIAAGIYLALDRWGMQFATVMVLVVLLSRVLTQLSKVQKNYQKMIMHESAFWSLKRTIKKANKAREDSGGTRDATLAKGIRFEHVTFGYGKKQVLDDISLELPAHSLTTIIGPSGAGKTTFIDLIIGLYQPVTGTVFLDDTPLPQVNLAQWRRKIGYVPQEQILLHDSIMINTTFRDPELTRADAEAALRSAGAWEFVSAMPEGMDSSVGERGAKLSGGQRQRIMIARALAHKPEVLILDEPTSALDPTNELLVCNTLQQLGKGYTILAISHQTALADVADQTYRLENGKLQKIDRKRD